MAGKDAAPHCRMWKPARRGPPFRPLSLLLQFSSTLGGHGGSLGVDNVASGSIDAHRYFMEFAQLPPHALPLFRRNHE